jgi:hypothetical protein
MMQTIIMKNNSSRMLEKISVHVFVQQRISDLIKGQIVRMVDMPLIKFAVMISAGNIRYAIDKNIDIVDPAEKREEFLIVIRNSGSGWR